MLGFSRLLVIIFLLALILRTALLGDFPKGFHADEARVAWNALSILRTGEDDRGRKFNLYYDTFGDYRPTGIFYFTIPSLFIFDRSEFAVRLPSALFGALSIFPLYLLTKIITNNKKIATLSALLLAISPWHIQVSRATSEMVISVFFALLAIYFLIKLIKFFSLKYLLLTCSSILVSYLLYHSIRLLAPLFFITVIFFYLPSLKSLQQRTLTACAFLFVTALTLLFTFNTPAVKRFEQVSVFSNEDIKYEIDKLNENFKVFDTTAFVYSRRLLSEYSHYFSLDFLLGYSPMPYRYITAGTTLITLTEALFLIIGIVVIARKRQTLLPLLLLTLSPIPAALTHEDSPNLHRAFFMVPFLMIIGAYGIDEILNLKKYAFIIKTATAFGIIANILLFSFIYFSPKAGNRPFDKEYNLNGYSPRNIGIKEMVLKVNANENNYDKIIITNFPDDPYPWYAFFTNKNPREFNHYVKVRQPDNILRYKNIVFSHVNCPAFDAFKSHSKEKLLVVNANSTNCAHKEAIKSKTIKAKVVDQVFLDNNVDIYNFLERN